MAIAKHKHADGSTVYQVRAYIDGKKRYIGTYPSLTAAKVAEADAISTHRASAKRGVTLGTFRDEWIASLHREDATLADYTTSINRAEDILGAIPLRDIGEREMDILVQDLVAADYAPRTVRKTVKNVRALLKAAQRLGHVREVPSPASMPRVDEKDIKPLTRKQVEAIIAKAPEYWRPLFVLAATSGMRRGELLALSWDNLDLDNATVKVEASMRYSEIVKPKTRAGRRTIHLPPQTVEALRHHTAPPSADGLVFPSQDGTRMNTSNFSKRVAAKVFEDAKVDGSMHMLRHTYASVLIRAGCSAKVVQTMMGHEDITTTLNTYGHLFPDEWDKAAGAIDEWLGTKSRNKETSQ